MTNESIKKIIDSLNRKETNDLMFVSKLSQLVDIAKVWTSLPEGNIGYESFYLFYFIKNDERAYMGAVQDMGNDLHVFVKTTHNGGFLENSKHL